MSAVDDRSIHLVSCIGVDTEFAHLPHFLDHYLALGVRRENVHLILNTDDAGSPNLARARALLESRHLPAPDVWIGPYTSDAMWARRRDLQTERVPADAWVVSADVDEFHEYPAPLGEIIAHCEALGVNCVQGVFIDRIAADGRLVDVDPDQPIGQTFALQGDVQCTVGRTGRHHDWFGTIKVMLLKAELLPSRGGHHPQNGDVPVRYLFDRHLARFPAIGRARFRFFIPFRVHHFKWTASMAQTLRRRLATPGVSAAGAEYGRKLVDYVEAEGGIRLADIPLRSRQRVDPLGWRRRVRMLRLMASALARGDDARYIARRIRQRLST